MAKARDIARRRRLAMENAARLERLVAPGVRQTARIWRNLRRELIRAPVEGVPVAQLIRDGFMAAAPILRDAMMLAWFNGIDHTVKVMRPRMAVLMAYERELATMFGKYELTSAEIAGIQQQFGKRAVETLTLSGDALERRIKPVVDRLKREGVIARDAVKQMRIAVEKSGVGPVKTYRLEAIYRTQVQIANSQARQEATRGDPLIDDILWGWEYATVGDERVRPEHAEQDGTRKPKNDPYWTVWTVPNGWACRCSMVEIFVDEVEAEDTRRPTTAHPDPGFDFNPGNLGKLAGIAANELVRRALT